MKILWIPYSGRSTASSRIRAFSVHDEIINHPDWGVTSSLDIETKEESWAENDVVVAQKTSDDATFDFLSSFKGLRLYDFDDVMSLKVMQRADEVCDAFITDTEGHRIWLQEKIGIRKRCLIIPDSVDYKVTGPMPIVQGSNEVAWFGNRENVSSILAPASVLMSYGVEMTLISNVHANIYPWAKVVPWSLENFPSDLRKFGTCLLYHTGGDLNGKSANKMVAAMCMGVPCLVNSGCCYENLALEVGYEVSVVHDLADIYSIHQYLNNSTHVRNNLMPRVQQRIWGIYNPTRVARKFIAAIRNL